MIRVIEDEVITISEVYKKVDNRRFTPGAPMGNVGRVVVRAPRGILLTFSRGKFILLLNCS